MIKIILPTREREAKFIEGLELVRGIRIYSTHSIKGCTRKVRSGTHKRLFKVTSLPI